MPEISTQTTKEIDEVAAIVEHVASAYVSNVKFILWKDRWQFAISKLFLPNLYFFIYLEMVAGCAQLEDLSSSPIMYWRARGRDESCTEEMTRWYSQLGFRIQTDGLNFGAGHSCRHAWLVCCYLTNHHISTCTS